MSDNNKSLFTDDLKVKDKPIILFASNDVLDPDETLRKRMIFLRFEGTLPSDIDQNAYRNKRNAIISRLSNALYREYLRRMLPEISNLLDMMGQLRRCVVSWCYGD